MQQVNYNNGVKIYQNSPYFKGEVVSAPNVQQNNSQPTMKAPLDNDVVEISTKKPKKQHNKLKECSLGIAAGILTCAGALTLIFKHRNDKLKQLYDNRMAFTHLAEHIDFKEAKTLEEGIDFAKNVLKIKNVDKNFTLEGINFANQGLVEVCNANKGHLLLPSRLIYTDMKNNTLASVIQTVTSDSFGALTINKKFFDDKFLNKRIKSYFGTSLDSKVPKHRKNMVADDFSFISDLDSEMLSLYKKFSTKPNSLSILDKRKLLFTIENASNKNFVLLKGCPIKTFDKMIPEFKKYGIKFDKVSFEKLSLKDQTHQIKDLLAQLSNKKGKDLYVDVPTLSPTATIHHELGHLQDFAKNLKDIDLSINSYGWKNALGLSEKYGKDAADVDLLANRWKGLTYDGFDKLFKEHPEQFKKKYPDLYEFLTKKEYQQAAGQVSEYATSSIGEFIAETYGMLVRGEKLSDDVINVYKKFGGPMLPC